MPVSSKEIERELYRMVDLLHQYDVDYWVDLGVLLGLAREGKPLAWDDDLEFGVWESEISKIQNVIRELPEFDYYTKSYNGLIQGITLMPKPQTDRVKTTFIIYYEGEDYAWSATGKRSNNWNIASRVHSAYHWHAKNNMLLDPILNTINDIKTRWVPKRFFKNKTHNAEFKVNMPYPLEDYLEYVYGEWKTPEKDYYYWRDSGLITDAEPSELINVEKHL